MSEVLKLVTTGYIPVPESDLHFADQIMTDLRSGKLTGFMLVAVGPETSGARVGFSGGRMDRMQLLGNLAIIRRIIEDVELGTA